MGLLSYQGKKSSNPPIKGGEVLARAGNEGVGTNPSNQGRGMWLAFCQGRKSSNPSHQGRKSPISLWKMVREVTVASGKSFCLVPSPLAGEG
jgi:hypothetical protein